MLESARFPHLVNYLGILGTVVFTVYGQMVLKWQVSEIPFSLEPKIFFRFFGSIVLNPWTLSCLLAGLCAFLSWTVALNGLELSLAYPYVASSFILVTLLSAIFFREPLTIAKVAGVALIVAGVIIGSQG